MTGVQREPAADLGVAIIWATLLISGAVMLCCGILAAQHWQAIDLWGDAAAILGAAPWHMYQRAIALTGAGLLAMAAYPLVRNAVAAQVPQGRLDTGGTSGIYAVFVLATLVVSLTTALADPISLMDPI